MSNAALRAVRPVFRSMNWGPPVAVGGAVVALAALVGRDGTVPPVPLLVRLIAILVAAGTAGLLDDAAQPSIEASPVTLRARRAIRIGLGWAVASVTLVTTMLILGARFDMTGFSSGRAAIEFAAILTLMTAAAGTALALGSSSGLSAGATAMMVFAVIMLRLPHRFSLIAAPVGTPAFRQESLRWGLVLVVTLVGMAWHLRDPASRRRAM